MTFFVSYTGVDEAWALWVAAELEAAGGSARVQAWDSPAGSNFVSWISEQMAGCERTVAICSPSYFESHWCTQEWTGALADCKVLPLRVAECRLPDVLQTIGYRDLFGVDEAMARRRLLEAVGLAVVERVASGFPGIPMQVQAAGPMSVPFPGRGPGVFEVPARNLRFTGRQELLERVRRGLAEAGGVAVTALQGMGGVGKTQVAIEYAHRFASSYEVVWWVDAEQVSLVGEQLASLGPRVGLAVTGQVDADAVAVLGWLRRAGGWLLVFDNAENPATLRAWLPDGPGHTLVTSRHPNWSMVGEAVEVDVMARAESVELLGCRVPGIDADTADALAEELGDLPLALEQAAAHLGETRMPPSRYLDKFRTRRAWMLDRGQDLAYRGSIATAWSLALEQLAHRAPAAVQLLEVCAQLAPEPIPVDLIADHPDILDPPLRHVVDGTDPHQDLDDTIAAVLAYALARRNPDDNTLQIHRLVADVIRTQQPPDRAADLAHTARRLVAAHRPEQSGEDPVGWPRWTQLLPHVLNAPALDLTHTPIHDEADTRSLLLHAGWVLNRRGDPATAHQLNTTLYTTWTTTLGPDHPNTLTSASILAGDLWALGEVERAQEINEDTLARRRRVLGDDHPDTLGSANNLAVALRALGEVERAREINEDTLARRRRVLGDNHPDTLVSANNLAVDLRALGEVERAQEINEDTLARRRRVLGDNHPDTLVSANNLANDLRALGEVERAQEIDEDTLARRQARSDRMDKQSRRRPA